MPAARLAAWVLPQLAPDSRTWTEAAVARVKSGGLTELGPAMARAGRRVDHLPLVPLPQGNFPSHWTADQGVRVLLAASLPWDPAARWLKDLDTLFSCAEVQESIALYQGLAFLPRPDLLAPRGAVGLRSSIESVWAAVALDNPFPGRHLEPAACRQMIMKGLFLGADVRRIIGLEAMTDGELGRMLRDFARERNAAGRPLPSHFDAVLSLCPSAHP